MYQVTTCPKTLDEVTLASKRLGCRNDRFGKNQYMCLPNEEKTSLFEFCHDGIMGIQEGGHCLEVNPSDGTLSTKNCTDFVSGCPEDVFWNHQFYMYPACQDINTGKQCYSSQPSCAQIVNVRGDSNLAYVIVVLVCVVIITSLTVFWVKRIRRAKQRRNQETETSHLVYNTEPVNCQTDKNVIMTENVQKVRRRNVGVNMEKNVQKRKFINRRHKEPCRFHSEPLGQGATELELMLECNKKERRGSLGSFKN